LMRHWAKLFGDRVFAVDYEQFVEAPEAMAGKLYGYCGLPWSPAYLEPAGRDRLVATASATQVRGAINRDSVGRWMRYERQLAPLRSQLREAGAIP
ncbi:MAG: sulfotransferase, partial [Steroidobacteraceae bacterium]